jgi:hypothetical protein
MPDSTAPWLFWAAFAQHPNARTWEIAVVKFTVEKPKTLEALVALSDPEAMLSEHGEGVGHLTLTGMSVRQAQTASDQRVAAQGLPTLASIVKGGGKHELFTDDRIEFYGCVPLDKVPEPIKLQALAGREF